MTARITVGAGRFVVEEQHPPTNAAIFDAFRLGISGFTRAGKGVGPLALEQGSIDLLVLLQPLGQLGIAAIAQPFMVDHTGLRGIAHTKTGIAHFERQIGVFEIGRRKLRTESANLAPEVRANHQSCRTHVVHLAGVGVGRFMGIAGAPIVPGRAIAPHQTSRFLQTSIGKDQLGTDHARIRPMGERKQQLLQPAGAGFGVVVEQHQVGSLCLGGSAATGLVETTGKLMAHHTHAGGIEGQRLSAAITRTVVHDDHLESHPGRGIGQGGEATAGDGVLVVDRNDNAHLGLG